ncbi:MAG: 4Fe-4S dicluster domain-containing protein [Candidatus Bathyarchaeia archaeon]
MMETQIDQARRKPFWAFLGLYPMWVILKQVMKRPVTVMYPYERLQLPENSRGGFALEMDACTGCGLCDWVCPDECIDMVAIEGKQTKINAVSRYPEVNIEKCCFCGLCTEICPKECIIMTPKHELSQYTRKDMYYDATRLSQEFESNKIRKDAFLKAPQVKGWRVFPAPNPTVKPEEKL